jgi:hypothetical protein
MEVAGTIRLVFFRVIPLVGTILQSTDTLATDTRFFDIVHSKSQGNGWLPGASALWIRARPAE